MIFMKSMISYEISECPPGYRLERTKLPINDNCVPCEYGTYRFDRSYANSSDRKCLPCHAKAECTGRDVAVANAGHLLMINISISHDNVFRCTRTRNMEIEEHRHSIKADSVEDGTLPLFSLSHIRSICTLALMS